jgi:hypothetical protein
MDSLIGSSLERDLSASANSVSEFSPGFARTPGIESAEQGKPVGLV